MHKRWQDSWNRGNKLATGGQGVTYVVTKIGNEATKGVLKCIRPENRTKAQPRARMHQEVASLVSLSSLCSNVPSVLDHNTELVNDDSAELYVVMEYIDGVTLSKYLEQRGHLDVDRSIQFVLSLCETIAIAHQIEILHRDIKPDNIIVRDDVAPRLALVDYGLSFNKSNPDITQTNETFRNKFVDLPETNTLTGNFRDPRSDITTVCAILYYCLTGHHIGHLQDAEGTLAHMRRGFSVNEKHSGPKVRLLEILLNKGLAHSVANRFQNIESLVTELEKVKAADAIQSESNPLQLASILSERIKSVDRQTQLGELVKMGQRIIPQLVQHALTYQNKLDSFTIEAGNIAQTSGTAEGLVPVGHELAFRTYQTITVRHSHHQLRCVCWFGVGISGNEGSLMFLSYVSEDQNYWYLIPEGSTWKVTTAMESGDLSELLAAKDALDSWICDQLRELDRRITKMNEHKAGL